MLNYLFAIHQTQKILKILNSNIDLENGNLKIIFFEA